MSRRRFSMSIGRPLARLLAPVLRAALSAALLAAGPLAAGPLAAAEPQNCVEVARVCADSADRVADEILKVVKRSELNTGKSIF